MIVRSHIASAFLSQKHLFYHEFRRQTLTQTQGTDGKTVNVLVDDSNRVQVGVCVSHSSLLLCEYSFVVLILTLTCFVSLMSSLQLETAQAEAAKLRAQLAEEQQRSEKERQQKEQLEAQVKMHAAIMGQY